MGNVSVNPNKERITRAQLITLYEAFKTHREKIAQQCGNRVDIMRLLHAETGIPVSSNALYDILETCGLELKDVITLRRSTAKVPGEGSGSVTRGDIRTLTQELANIARALGYQPSTAFLEMYERLMTRLYRGEATPVASVPNPKTIPVVK